MVAASTVETEPFCRRSIYMSTSITPCERRPSRSAPTSPSATVTAALCETPRAENSSATKAASLSAGMERASSAFIATQLPRTELSTSPQGLSAGSARLHRLLAIGERGGDPCPRAGGMLGVWIQRLVFLADDRGA